MCRKPVFDVDFVLKANGSLGVFIARWNKDTGVLRMRSYTPRPWQAAALHLAVFHNVCQLGWSCYPRLTTLGWVAENVEVITAYHKEHNGG